MGEPAMNIRQIMAILPHRYSFLFVDRVLELDPGKRCVAIKNVSANEPWVQGHWPNKPVMPGVLILEVMFQTGAIMLLAVPQDRHKTPFATGVDEVRWRRQVIPGDQLVIEATIDRRRGDIGRARGVACVDGKVACEGIFKFSLVSPATPNL